MYTSRYNACDLNEMPEQLCAGVSHPSPPVLNVQSYLELHHLVQQNQDRREMGKVSCTGALHVSIAALVQPRKTRELIPATRNRFNPILAT